MSQTINNTDIIIVRCYIVEETLLGIMKNTASVK